MPVYYQLVLYRGDSAKWVFRFWQDRNKTQPVDLTGTVVGATIAIGGVSVSVPCVITLPNEVTMTVAEAEWSNLSVGSGRWDLQLTDADGWIHTPLAGPVSIQADVTDAASEYAIR